MQTTLTKHRKPTPTMAAATAVMAMALFGSAWAQVLHDDQAAIDIGSTVLNANDVKEGLFPDDECEALKAAGFKCMGFKPAVKYSLPASSFEVGSAVIPALLKQQLDVFAEVLRSKNASSHKVSIVGHADASGSAASNLELSKRRAAAVQEYLVQMGVNRTLINAEGMGASTPKNKRDPYAAENRRVEIGRAK